jgi:nucleoside-diphosphate-sugar epimerase
VINVALGKDTPAPLVGATVFVNDCAEVHVRALDERVKGNQNFIASAGPVVWNDVNEIVKNGFGVKAMEHGLKLGGTWIRYLLILILQRRIRNFG